jgi:hypothetical protein
MKVLVIRSYRDKDLEVEVITDKFCPEGTVYFLSQSEPKVLLLENPITTIEKLKKSYEEKMQNRLKGLNYWKQKYEKSVDS